MKQNSLKKGKNLKVSGNLSTKDLDYLEKSTKKYNSTEKMGTHLWNAPDVVALVELKLGIRLDLWQRVYIFTEGDTSARIGRQSGKSIAVSIKLGLFALKYKPPKKGLHELITGYVERQAYELFMKVRRFIEAVAPNQIVGRPTMKQLKLKSGFTILALPCGRDGAGLRNYACAKIAFDEAHYIADEVFIALRPMLITTRGSMDLISTTRGSKGYFRETFQQDSGFTNFHYKTRDVYLEREICASWTKEQREFALKFLDKEEKRMTKNQFKQEYEAEFIDELQQLFPSDLIDECILKESNILNGRNF